MLINWDGKTENDINLNNKWLWFETQNTRKVMSINKPRKKVRNENLMQQNQLNFALKDSHRYFVYDSYVSRLLIITKKKFTLMLLILTCDIAFSFFAFTYKICSFIANETRMCVYVWSLLLFSSTIFCWQFFNVRLIFASFTIWMNFN